MTNVARFYIKFLLKGISQSYEYIVTEEEQNKIDTTLQNIKGSRDNLFLFFNTIDGLHVGISINEIQSVQLLWDTGIFESSINNKYLNNNLSILLKYHSEQFSIETDTNDDIFIWEFIDHLHHISSPLSNDFLPIIDIDGEKNFFNIKEILKIEISNNRLNKNDQQTNIR